MYDLIYSLIIFFATFLGAFVGLGGGVIIKPLLDLIGHDSIATVNFISAFAVFSMSISSTIKHIKAKTKIDFKFIITLSALLQAELQVPVFSIICSQFLITPI